MGTLQMNRRMFVTSVVGVVATAVVNPRTVLAAQGALEKITLLVPFAAGSGSFDVTCRAVAATLNATKLVGSVTVKNVDGAGGARGYEYLIDKSVDNSNTVIMVGTSIIARSGKGVFPYKVGDLIPVASFSIEPLTFAVKAKSRFKAIKDIIAALKANPSSVNFASDSDRGLSEHLCAAKMLFKAGIVPKSVNYTTKSGHGKHIEALLAEEIDVVIVAAADILPYYKDKSVQVLASSTETRIATMPDVPTLAETGIPNAVFYNARGFFMAPGTDFARAEAMGALLEKMVGTPEWRNESEKASVTMLFSRLPDAKKFFEGQERDVHELQIALGVAKL